MCGTENRKELPLTSSGAGCSCCSTDAPEGSVTSTGGAEYAVDGLTCGHCLATVRNAVAALDGVEAASVDLVAGGLSRLVISGSAAETAIRDAVTSAGYSLVATR
jgi:copper chaperone CopZ